MFSLLHSVPYKKRFAKLDSRLEMRCVGDVDGAGCREVEQPLHDVKIHRGHGTTRRKRCVCGCLKERVVCLSELLSRVAQIGVCWEPWKSLRKPSASLQPVATSRHPFSPLTPLIPVCSWLQATTGSSPAGQAHAGAESGRCLAISGSGQLAAPLNFCVPVVATGPVPVPLPLLVPFRFGFSHPSC